MQSAHARVLTRNELLVGSMGLAVLWSLSFQSYLLFHAVSEFFSIAVACGIFLVAYNTRAISQNGYLLFLGLAYAFVASVDLLHLLAFKGMGVFPGQGADLGTQFWI
ncbi:MAG: hybrid sensor histidine kinase/response regulator, partial [Proteobacteria bacterium]|nr:hybrid sensor histidine kinase/response regulator [Pseudomonadota bacterium]